LLKDTFGLFDSNGFVEVIIESEGVLVGVHVANKKYNHHNEIGLSKYGLLNLFLITST
jgi:hypothetical protein